MFKVLNRKFDNFIFVVAFFLTNINVFLVKFGINYVHYGIILIYLIVNAYELVGLKSRINKGILFYFQLYAGSIFTIVLVNLIFYEVDILVIFNSLCATVLIPLFGIVILVRNKINFKNLFNLIIASAIFASVFGIYQFFFDKTLFGVYSFSDFYIEELIFRTRGNLSSPQVYGLYLAIASVISLEFYKKEQKRVYLWMGIYIFLAGFLSGNKSVVFILIFYAAATLRNLNKVSPKIRTLMWRTLFIGIISIPVIIFINPSGITSNKSITQLLDRVNIFSSSDENDVIKSEESGRLRIYSEHFSIIQNNPALIFFGQGIGSYSSLSRSDNENLVASESYFLQIFLEYGVFPLLFLLLIFKQSLTLHARRKDWISYYSVLAIAVSGIFVHAFIYPIFLVFWLLILF